MRQEPSGGPSERWPRFWLPVIGCYRNPAERAEAFARSSPLGFLPPKPGNAPSEKDKEARSRKGRAQLDLCVGEFDREQARAEEAGCASERQAFIDCLADKAMCTSTGDLTTEVCNPEEDVHLACMRKK